MLRKEENDVLSFIRSGSQTCLSGAWWPVAWNCQGIRSRREKTSGRTSPTCSPPCGRPFPSSNVAGRSTRRRSEPFVTRHLHSIFKTFSSIFKHFSSKIHWILFDSCQFISFHFYSFRALSRTCCSTKPQITSSSVPWRHTAIRLGVDVDDNQRVHRLRLKLAHLVSFLFPFKNFIQKSI